MTIDFLTYRRLGAPKSRLGCTTCKQVDHSVIRRVKCGEEKPTCLRCSSTGRRCEYKRDRVSSLDPSTPPTPGFHRPLSLSPNAGARERRAFEYYFQHAARHLAGGLKVDFWTKVIPQICRSEPAVWDGMIAISALFEHPNQCLDFTLLRNRRKASHGLNQIQQEALTWYSRSISTVHSQISRGSVDQYTALISCVLFICVETIQGRMEEALQLFGQGVTLIGDLRTQRNHGKAPLSKEALLEHTIIPLFLRLGTMSLTISGTQPSEIFSLMDNNIGLGFSSVEHARSTMVVLAAEVMIFEREAVMHLRAVGANSVDTASMIARKQALQTRLLEWNEIYTDFCRNHCGPTTAVEPDPLLPIYCAAASITLTGCLTSLETVFDAHLVDFAAIVEQATLILNVSRRPDGSQPPFTFESGVGVPLFLTALKCRHSSLRRRALQLLRQAPPLQGFFKCAPSTLMAASFMTMEESYTPVFKSVNATVAERIENGNPGGLPGSLPMVNVADPQDIQVPEEARIHYYCIFRPKEWCPPGVALGEVAKFGCGPDQLFLRFSRNHFDTNSKTWREIFECIPLGGSL
ncbi:transcriptional regulator family: Fungal Specific TF [Penicillium longicatenatum]|uniref:transcriptional regulator family: Fungal Specific TF n=1 Tax=Penicillium longicatenatum TaxID=1561947 RepID=UPI00254966F4|nr:transcriptional regulator family: Fungal Specific TF [Penicillium longicatenatum]KAJ5658843.1 transcriptional regulator family: Fungal Specific TF [Penicillium longicatenatum]